MGCGCGDGTLMIRIFFDSHYSYYITPKIPISFSYASEVLPNSGEMKT